MNCTTNNQHDNQAVQWEPLIKRMLDYTLGLKAENQRLKDQLSKQTAPLFAGKYISDDPHEVLTHDLPDDLVGQCEELEKRILSALGSGQLAAMSIEHQIPWIQEIFLQCIFRLHPKSIMFASLIDDLLPKIFRCQSLKFSSACYLYDAMYGLYWCGAQSLMDMRGFNVHTVRLFREFLAKKGLKVCNGRSTHIKLSGKIRVAYFCHYADHSRGNALAPVVTALAKSHAEKDDREIFIYCVQWSAQEFIDSFEGTTITVRNFPNQSNYDQLDSLADAIRCDNIDVVITEVASSIATYLFAKRVAPLQIWLEPGFPFWSVPDVDWVLLPGKVWQPWFGVPSNKYSHLRLNLPTDSIKQTPADSQLQDAGKCLPCNAVIYAVFTRLIKITPVYLAVVSRILRHIPEAHMLVVGTGDSRLVNSFVQDEALKGRVTLLNENVDLNIYGRLINIFLDTFPFIGGLACRDVASHGKPVVSLLAGEWDILLKNERIPSLLAKDTEEYFQMAVCLGLDKKFYKECAEQTLQLAKQNSEGSAMISDVEFGISSAMQSLSSHEVFS